MSSVICFNLDQSKVLSSGNGLIAGNLSTVFFLQVFSKDVFLTVLEALGCFVMVNPVKSYTIKPSYSRDKRK